MVNVFPDRLLLDALRTLRHTLHVVPEPAGQEAATADVVASFLATYHPDQLVTGLGGHGLAAVYEGREPGPTVMVRCELDALAVELEELGEGDRGAGNRCDHRCGHDGHMAIVAGLAPLLHYAAPKRGRVVLLFQPAEETGEGAQRVVDDDGFVHLQPDVVVGLHNLPGYPANAIVLRDDIFSSASAGLHVRLDGVGAHAAEPEKGVSPAFAVATLLERLPSILPPGDEGRTVTVTHAQLGRPSFGLTPGHAEVWATLRARTVEALGSLRVAAEQLVVNSAEQSGLVPTISWHQSFPETRNDPKLVDLLREACARRDLPVVELEQPFAWSEDFGVYARRWPAVFFGLGIGEHAVPLHQQGYSFPDDCLESGLRVFSDLIGVIGERWPERRAIDPLVSGSAEQAQAFAAGRA